MEEDIPLPWLKTNSSGSRYAQFSLSSMDWAITYCSKKLPCQ
jgi:hypothetical protein